MLGVEPDWILCGNGSDDILTIVTRALVGQRQWLRLPYPSYILYKTLAELQGAEAEEVRFERDWSLSDEFAAPRRDLKLVFLPNPNSPSGTVVPPERVLELAERLPCPLAGRRGLRRFRRRRIACRWWRESDKIMVSRSLSKSYALAGLRFGFLVAQPHLIEQLVKVKDSYNCDALAIAGATAAIDDQAWLAENRAKILATRARLTAGMRELGFATVDSQANFVWNPHPSVPRPAALRAAESQRRPGPIHGLSGLGGRAADFGRHRRADRRLPGAAEDDDLRGTVGTSEIRRGSLEKSGHSRRRANRNLRHGPHRPHPAQDGRDRHRAGAEPRRLGPGADRHRRRVSSTTC